MNETSKTKLSRVAIAGAFLLGTAVMLAAPPASAHDGHYGGGHHEGFDHAYSHAREDACYLGSCGGYGYGYSPYRGGYYGGSYSSNAYYVPSPVPSVTSAGPVGSGGSGKKKAFWDERSPGAMLTGFGIAGGLSIFLYVMPFVALSPAGAFGIFVLGGVLAGLFLNSIR